MENNIQLWRERSVAHFHAYSRTVVPSLWAWRRKALVVGVYSHDNAAVLTQLVQEAKRSRWDVSLWALDRVHPSLAAYSLGAGKSPKFPLMNRLMRDKDLSQFDWVVVTDDDVVFEQGSLAAFLYAAEKAGLALAQPAHAVGSFSNHEITLWKPHTMARLTTFVEIGPLFAINRKYYDKVLPFPERSGMGWGLDVEWSDLQAIGARLGIVDWVALRHLRPLGSAGTYNMLQEEQKLLEILRARGHDYVSQFHRTLAIWHEWESRPPWLRGGK